MILQVTGKADTVTSQPWPEELPVKLLLRLFGLELDQMPPFQRLMVDVGWEYHSDLAQLVEDDPGLLLIGFEPNPDTWRKARGIVQNGLPCGVTAGCIVLLPFAVGNFGARSVGLQTGSFPGCNSLLPGALPPRHALVEAGLPRCRELLARGVRLPRHSYNASLPGDITARDLPGYVRWLADKATMCGDGFDGSELPVPTLPLALLLDELAPLEVEFMKIDAQCTDLQVLQSAGPHLSRIRRVQLEAQDLAPGDPGQLYRGAGQLRDLREAMEHYGFELDGCTCNSCVLLEYDCTFRRQT